MRSMTKPTVALAAEALTVACSAPSAPLQPPLPDRRSPQGGRRRHGTGDLSSRRPLLDPQRGPGPSLKTDASLPYGLPQRYVPSGGHRAHTRPSNDSPQFPGAVGQASRCVFPRPSVGRRSLGRRAQARPLPTQTRWSLHGHPYRRAGGQMPHPPGTNGRRRQLKSAISQNRTAPGVRNVPRC